MKIRLSALFICSCITNHLLATSGLVILVGIPKCGTHLLSQTVSLLTDTRIDFIGDFGCGYKLLSEKGVQNLKESGKRITHSHLLSTENNFDLATQHAIKILFIYRDPRDQVVSLFYHKQRPPAVGASIPRKPQRPLTQLISEVNNRYRNQLGWIKQPNVYAIKFEDLIGPKGGGSQNIQLQVMRNIADFLGLHKSDEEIKNLANKVHGSNMSWTFRKGQIGAWKKEFTRGQRLLFRDKNQALLEELGYETNDRWVNA